MKLELYTNLHAFILLGRHRHAPTIGRAASEQAWAICGSIAQRSHSFTAAISRLAGGLKQRVPLFEEDPQIRTLRSRIKR